MGQHQEGRGGGIGAHPDNDLSSIAAVVGSDSRTMAFGVSPGIFRIFPVGSLIRNDEVSILSGSDETESSDDILEVRNARIISVTDKEDERRNVSSAVSGIREYLFQQEVIAIDVTIIDPQQRPPIMTQLRTKSFFYKGAAGIALFCAMGMTFFILYYSIRKSSTTVESNKKYDTESMIPSLSNLLSLSKKPSFAPSIRRSSKYHDFFDTFKIYTPEYILSNPLTPQHRALLWLANDDNRTMLTFDTKLYERYALVTLFFATGGGEGYWHNNYNFLSDRDVCDWMAVSAHINKTYDGGSRSNMMGAACSASEGRSVSELALLTNNLVGTIPEELKLLTSLQFLGFLENKIHGTIPSLSSFQNLHYLFLAHNQLRGTIPEFNNNLKLRSVNIAFNDLTGTIPESLRKLKNILNIQLDQNKLRGSLPNWIGELKLLKYLSTSNNAFHHSKIPLSINKLHNLEYLDLSNTQLIGFIPITNNSLPRLEYLLLNDNLLSGTFPNAITTSTRIKVIMLDRNILTEQLSTEISMMRSCMIFSVTGNEFSGSISPLLKLLELNHLSLGSNKFSGNIPLEIGNLRELKTINLDFNNLTGAIPTTFSKLSQLVSVDLSNNQIFGNLTEICLKAPDLERFTSDCLSPDIILCPCCTYCC